MRTVVLIACLVLAAPAAARAQHGAAPEESAPREPTRLYFGMWTTHLKHDVVALDNNWALGVSYRGVFAATFLNSFGRRAFAAGIQRTIAAMDARPLGVSLGYRVGLVSGYDGRFMRVARDMPVLPFVQPLVTVDVQRLGFEVSYTFVIVSVAMSYRF
jgi:hypothetical protein